MLFFQGTVQLQLVIKNLSVHYLEQVVELCRAFNPSMKSPRLPNSCSAHPLITTFWMPSIDVKAWL